MVHEIVERKPSHWLTRYLLAVLAAVIAFVLLFIPGIGRAPEFVLFVAVLISAWQGGVGAGILTAAVIECLAAYTFYRAGTLFTSRRLVTLAELFAFSVALSLMMQALHAVRGRVEAGRRRLAAVLTSIGDAVIATDASGRVAFMNPVAESLCGWAGADAAGRPLEEVFHIVNEFTRRPAENPVRRVLAEGGVVGLANHTLLIGRDGTERPIDDSAAPIRDAVGEVDGVVLVFRDVTERRRYEAKLIEDARRKDEFLAMLAHELRNPLAAIANAVADPPAARVPTSSSTGPRRCSTGRSGN